MHFSPAKIYPARKEKKCAFLEKFLGELVVTSSRLVPAGAWKWREHFGKGRRFGGCSQQIRIPPGRSKESEEMWTGAEQRGARGA